MLFCTLVLQVETPRAVPAADASASGGATPGPGAAVSEDPKVRSSEMYGESVYITLLCMHRQRNREGLELEELEASTLRLWEGQQLLQNML